MVYGDHSYLVFIYTDGPFQCGPLFLSPPHMQILPKISCPTFKPSSHSLPSIGSHSFANNASLYFYLLPRYLYSAKVYLLNDPLEISTRVFHGPSKSVCGKVPIIFPAEWFLSPIPWSWHIIHRIPKLETKSHKIFFSFINRIQSSINYSPRGTSSYWLSIL